MNREYNEYLMGHDIGDWLDNLRANALSRTGLGGPEMDPSPTVSALRAPSLSQEQLRGAGAAQKAARHTNGGRHEGS